MSQKTFRRPLRFADAAVLPFKLVPNAAEAIPDPMTCIWDFVQQGHNFIVL